MTPRKIFDTYGALYIKDVVSKDLSNFFSHVLMRAAQQKKIMGGETDTQVPNSLVSMSHEIMFDTLLERVWPALEEVLEEELIPTYAFSRLYNNGDVLEKHTDRPECEISVTVQLARTHHYAWPIYMGKQRFDLAEGDGIIYKGCDVNHWRNACDGPEGYLSGQVFLHYVRANGQYADRGGDSLNTRPHFKNEFFIRHRHVILEKK